jgi:hypothetical protein
MPTPLLYEYLGFFQREEDFTVEQFFHRLIHRFCG